MLFAELGRAGVKLTGRPSRECPDKWLNEGGKGGGDAVPPPETFAPLGRVKDHPLCFTQFAVLGNLCHNPSNTTVTAVGGRGARFLPVWWYLPCKFRLRAGPPRLLVPGHWLLEGFQSHGGPRWRRGRTEAGPGRLWVWLRHPPPSSVTEVASVLLQVILGACAICREEARSPWLHLGVKEAPWWRG